ncbi:hypothetical protein H4J59_04620 [Colwellia sp. MB02u-10]|jgi:hypothetical protein|uniref:hypothetical protein n=1 Tax=Colwellia sp. MB02u-10 TaxID=2759828 RepID=UPI0015F45D22|nr:hypothetical protein [Colwellia sp. MB02u-10]MBA6340278.1 hypothetical protein [Colwellia sp. MB02u-10]
MNNDIKGICLFLGLIGLGYVALLILVALLTGAKVIKSIMFISIFSTFLISLGLTPQVKNRLSNYLKSLNYKKFV